MKRLFYAPSLALTLGVIAPALAQHDHHAMPGRQLPADTAQKMGSMNMPADSSHRMSGMGMGMSTMSHAYSRNLPMNRNGSGTAWQPDQTPMYMWMQHRGPWMLMYHGSAFGRYTSQNFNHNDARGHASAVDGPNWLMT
ncbi:MAG: hypothetical protein EOO56_29730, partial [Hymenobacter sp.]